MRPPPIMNFNEQNRSCHAERSEASLCSLRQTLRCAQGDNTLPILIVKTHYQPKIPSTHPLNMLRSRCIVEENQGTYQCLSSIMLNLNREPYSSASSSLLSSVDKCCGTVHCWRFRLPSVLPIQGLA